MDRFATLRRGLIGAWCPSLGATGYTLLDRSGRNQHGTLTNMGGQSNWVASGSGTALALDGSNDYVPISSAFGSSYLNGSFTLSCWVRHGVVTQNYPGVFMHSNSQNVTHGAGLLAIPQSDSANTKAVYCAIGDGVTQTGVIPSFATTDNVWRHYAATVSRASLLIELWVNGIRIGGASIASVGTINVTRVAEIGRRTAEANSVSYFPGQIDDARVYARSLPPSEIKLLASQRGIGLVPTRHKRTLVPVPAVPVVNSPARIRAAGGRRSNPYESLRRGLVGAWCPSLGGSARLIADRAGSNNARGASGVTLSARDGGTMLRMNAASPVITFGGASLVGLTAISVSFWFKRDTAISTAVFVQQGDAENNRMFFGPADQNAFIGGRFASGDLYRFASISSYSVSRLHHFVGVYIPGVSVLSGQRVFINGVALSLQTVGAGNNPVVPAFTTPLDVGARFTGSATTFTGGELDDIRVYNRELTLAEIRLLASQRGIGLVPTRQRNLPSSSKSLWRNVDGVWKETQPLVNVNGIWKPATIWQRQNGVWKN